MLACAFPAYLGPWRLGDAPRRTGEARALMADKSDCQFVATVQDAAAEEFRGRHAYSLVRVLKLLFDGRRQPRQGQDGKK